MSSPKETLVQSEFKLPQLEFELSMPIPFPRVVDLYTIHTSMLQHKKWQEKWV